VDYLAARELIMPHMKFTAKNRPELVVWETIARGLNLWFEMMDE